MTTGGENGKRQPPHACLTHTHTLLIGIAEQETGCGSQSKDLLQIPMRPNCTASLPSRSFLACHLPTYLRPAGFPKTQSCSPDSKKSDPEQ